jgi:EmrB/QacA subfamily drug resistance transporter
MSKPANGSPLLTLAAVCVVQFTAPFMLTAVGVALPSLGRDLHASAVQLGLVEQLYALSLAMTMLTFGRLGDLRGQGRVFLAGLVVFTAMTASLGLTRSVEMIMIQRFFQGLGGAMVLSGSLALVAAAYPPQVRGRMIGLVSASTYAGLSCGPVIGGFVTAHFGWRSVFLMSAPLGLAAAVLCLLGVPLSGTDREEPMDWRGAVLFGLAVGLVMLGAAHAREVPAGPLMMLSGLAVFGFFSALERRQKHPLLDFSLFTGNRYLSLSCLAAFGNYAATFGITFLMSLYLQYAKGLSPRQAGFALLAQPLMQVIFAPLAGRLADRHEPARIATLGIVVSAAGLLLAAASTTGDTPLWLLIPELALIGAGFGLFVSPNSAAIMASVDRTRFGLASGLIGVMRTLGMAANLTCVAFVFSLFLGDAAVTAETLPAFLDAMRTGLAASAVLACLGVGVSLGRGRRKTG